MSSKLYHQPRQCGQTLGKASQLQAALELLETIIRNEREVESDSQQMGGMNAQDDQQNI